MDATLTCLVVLSKKLRSLMGDGGTLTLHVKNIANGRGDGSLFVSTDGEMTIPDDLMRHETNIMFTPIGMAEDNVDFTRVGNIF